MFLAIFASNDTLNFKSHIAELLSVPQHVPVRFPGVMEHVNESKRY